MGVEITRDGAVAIATITSGGKLNVGDVPTMNGLRDELLRLAAEDGVRAVVLTAEGDRAFCAGADIAYMSGVDAEQARAFAQLGHDVASLLETMPKPTIAAVNGLALGGGCELALACDLRYAASSARFGLPEVKIGIIPGWGGTQRLARATGVGFAKELILTGRLVDAEEALARGLVSEIHDPVLDRALDVARTLATRSATALAAAKDLCNRALQGDLEEALDEEALRIGELLVGADAREGFAAFLEKREPRFG